MTDEVSPQNQYLYEVAKHMKETSERLERKLDANTELTQSTLVQATKTNGRVNGLEQYSEDTKKAIEALITSNNSNKEEIISINEKHESDKRLIIAVLSVAAFLLGALGYFFQLDIKNYNEKLLQDQIKTTEKTIGDSVVSTLEEKYNMQITK